MPPRQYIEWHNKTWQVRRIENHPGVGVGDIITFASRGGGTRISSVSCSTHGSPPPHGSEWNGADCDGVTGHPNKVTGRTRSTRTAFGIVSSLDEDKHVLTCGLQSDLSSDPTAGACWIAEELP